MFDRYDLAFATYFKGVDAIFDIRAEIPEEWLRKEFERLLSPEDKAKIEALGGWDKLMETLKAAPRGTEGAPRGRQQVDRHRRHESFRRLRLQSRGHPRSGKPAAATAARSRSGTSAASGTSTATSSSIRATSRSRCEGSAGSRARASPKSSIWTGRSRGTAKNAGYLDLHLVPERRNRVKVLLFLDVGGSMDPHVRVCEELFSATKTEFRHLEYFYFHNCVYDHVWRDNARRRNERVADAGTSCTNTAPTGRRSSSATRR